MADNYLEKKFEQLGQPRTVVKRTNPSLDTLLKRNRSYRGYDPARVVSREELVELVRTVTLIPSGMNRQPLRFRLVTADEAGKVLPYITLGAALPEEHLPHPGEEPRAFLVVCSAFGENKVVDIDLGFAAQSILLKAAEMGLNGIFVLNMRAAEIRRELDLPSDPLAVIAIGKGTERIFLLPVEKDADLAYFRKDGVHYVPKHKVEDLLI